MRHTLQYALTCFILLCVIAFSLLPILTVVPAILTHNSQVSGGLDLLNYERLNVANGVENFTNLAKNGIFVESIARTIVFSILVGALTTYCAISTSYLLTRVAGFHIEKLSFIAFTAYLTPPIILALAYSSMREDFIPNGFSLLLVAGGLCTFIFPLCYGLSLSRWKNYGWDIDRAASADGASLWMRFSIHMKPGSPMNTYALGLSLLSFMLSWGDITFSRVLLQGNEDSRLFTDIMIDLLILSDKTEPFGEVAAIAFATTLVSALASSAYGFTFFRSNKA
jgi:ABC-type Fe3+ transport system permease subunit